VWSIERTGAQDDQGFPDDLPPFEQPPPGDDEPPW